MATTGESRERGASAFALEHSWRRQLPLWDAGFAVVGVGVVAAMLVGDDGPRTRLAAGVVVLLGLAYAVWGRALIGSRPVAGRWSYVVLAWGCFLAAVTLSGRGEPWVLLAALFPQTWMMLSTRSAIAVTVAVTGLVAILGLTLAPGGEASGRWLAMTVPMMLGLSIGPGLLIAWLNTQAMTRARLLDELHEARAEVAAAHRREGIAAERERVSRELHDTVAQGFTSIVALTDASRAALARGDVETATCRLELAERAARDNLAETRLLVAERSAVVTGRGLPEALDRLVQTIAAHSGVAGRFSCDGDPGDAPEVEMLVVRAAQEALANVRRHSRATSFDVRLSAGPSETVLVVTDDGVGFDPATQRHGFGLDGLVDRARACGADLDVDSWPGRGTTITLRVPS